MNTKRGFFIVIEGIDQSGKTTISRELVKKLNEKNKQTVYQRFPDTSTEIGKLIYNYLTTLKDYPQETIHLLYSANRWELNNYIKETLNKGINIVCDRYMYSGIVYSLSTGLSKDWCENPDNGLVKPDIIFYLNVSLYTTKQRRKLMKTDKYENDEFQERVKKTYEEYKYGKGWVTINGEQDLDKITELMLSIINSNFK